MIFLQDGSGGCRAGGVQLGKWRASSGRITFYQKLIGKKMKNRGIFFGSFRSIGQPHANALRHHHSVELLGVYEMEPTLFAKL
jgi:hypothetical protein